MKIVNHTSLGPDVVNCHYHDPRFGKLWK